MLYRKYFQRRLYLNAHKDDVELTRAAKKWLDENQLTYDSYIALHEQIDIDLATHILYVYLTEYKQPSFFNLLNQLPVSHFNNHQKIKFLIIPGMFYQERPEMGSDGALFASIAHRLGFEVEVVKTKSLGAISHNIPIILQAIEANQSNALWLVSLSRGSLEVRACLQKLMNPNLIKSIQGWLNINGSCYGTFLADYQLSSWPKRILARSLCSIFDMDYQGINEMRATNPNWIQNFPACDSMTLIHLAAFPYSSTVSLQVQSRYARLCQYGPNDGVVLLKDYLRTPGYIYPILGVDHMMRSPKMGTLFYKLCYLIENQVYRDVNYEQDHGVSNSVAG